MFLFKPNSRPSATVLPLKQTAMPSNPIDKLLKAVFTIHAEQTQNSVQFINSLTLLSSATIPYTCN